MSAAPQHAGTDAEIIAEITTVLDGFNRHFNPPNIDEIVKYYHRDVIHYVANAGRFYRGRDELRAEFFAPFVAGVAWARLDFSPMRFQVVSRDLVISYGAIPGMVYLANGETMEQPPLPQTITWLRNPEGDPARPFVVLAAHE